MRHRSSRGAQRPAAPRRERRAPLLAAALGALTLGAAAAPQEPAGVEGTRAALERWVETRRVLSQERRDWMLGREILGQRIELVRQEIESVRKRLAEAEEGLAQADVERLELVRESEALTQASEALEGVLVRLEGRTRALLARLPDPIRERVAPLSQRLPAEPVEGEDPREDSRKGSLGERFGNVVGILNEVNKFQREVTLTSEVRELPSGTTAEVTALYLGLGQGYYVDASGLAAGVGSAWPQGWAWEPADDAAPAIARAIAILKNEEVADFVPLPVRIQ